MKRGGQDDVECAGVPGFATRASTRADRMGLRLRLVQRVAGRLAARAGRWVGRGAPEGRTPAGTALNVVMGATQLRELKLGDARDWSESRLANTARMRHWWGDEDWSAASSESAFLDHYLSWAVTKKKGRGFALALVENEHLVGELHVYLHHGGRVAELGCWMRPGGMPARALSALCGSLVDHLVFEWGVVRIDAPVAVGNAGPVTLLTLGGFVREGRLVRWRPLGSNMSDMDMYGLTDERWVSSARARLRANLAWPESQWVQAKLTEGYRGRFLG